jgi:U3 small nucleolar RNA-associated protein 14
MKKTNEKQQLASMVQAPAAVSITMPNESTFSALTRNDDGESGDDKEVNFFSQRDLIQLAFANDDVIEQEFEQEKQDLADEGAPKDKDVTLPGWGNWSGAKKSAKPQRRFIIPAAPGSGIDPTKRQDRNLKHVIINEQRDKKFVKYMAEQLPFPFKSRDQYDAVRRTPLGPEWNSATMHHKLTKPKVTTKLGKVIEPLKFVAQPKDKRK